MAYPKFTWVGNKISDEDMAELYRIKQLTKKPITEQVSEAVARYIADNKQTQLCNYKEVSNA